MDSRLEKYFADDENSKKRILNINPQSVQQINKILEVLEIIPSHIQCDIGIDIKLINCPQELEKDIRSKINDILQND